MLAGEPERKSSAVAVKGTARLEDLVTDGFGAAAKELSRVALAQTGPVPDGATKLAHDFQGILTADILKCHAMTIQLHEGGCCSRIPYAAHVVL